MKHKYVAMKLQRWENLTAWTPAQQRIAGIGKSIGILLVYNNKRDLVADEGKGVPFIVVKPDKRKETTNGKRTKKT